MTNVGGGVGFPVLCIDLPETYLINSINLKTISCQYNALHIGGCQRAIRSVKLCLQPFPNCVETDWNLSGEDWSMMSRCNKCARQLYPYSSKSSDAWSEQAFRKWKLHGIRPEEQRDNQSPGILNLINKRPPRL